MDTKLQSNIINIEKLDKFKLLKKFITYSDKSRMIEFVSVDDDARPDKISISYNFIDKNHLMFTSMTHVVMPKSILKYSLHDEMNILSNEEMAELEKELYDFFI